MMPRSILSLVLIFSTALALSACNVLNSTPPAREDGAVSPAATVPEAPAGKISADLPGTDSLKITSPAAGAVVVQPLIVRGEAKGSWYFEASFPVRLVDEEGNELARATAQAQGDWMTEAFVPFAADFTSFDVGTATAGKLIFEKDNPSGLPENAESFEMPVQF